MVFICKGCSNDPCSLTVNDADFDPLFCPFDQDIDVVKWVPEGAKNTEQANQPDLCRLGKC